MTTCGDWRLAAEKESKGGASCIAQHKGCRAFYQGQWLHFWLPYIMAILEDVKMEQMDLREVVRSWGGLLHGHFCTWLFSGQSEVKRGIKSGVRVCVQAHNVHSDIQKRQKLKKNPQA